MEEKLLVGSRGRFRRDGEGDGGCGGRVDYEMRIG